MEQFTLKYIQEQSEYIMDYPQNLSKSDQRWYDLIQECRTSGKSDRQWLLENNIGSGTFYYHVKQLRKYSFMSTRQKENPAFLQGRWLFDIDFCTLKS